MLKNAHVDIPEVKENFEAVMKLVEGNPYAALTDVRTTISITKEAREFAARPEYFHLQVAHAIVINSLPNRLLANFIIKFHKPASPTKLFSDFKAAHAWLKERLNEQD